MLILDGDMVLIRKKQDQCFIWNFKELYLDVDRVVECVKPKLFNTSITYNTYYRFDTYNT